MTVPTTEVRAALDDLMQPTGPELAATLPNLTVEVHPYEAERRWDVNTGAPYTQQVFALLRPGSKPGEQKSYAATVRDSRLAGSGDERAVFERIAACVNACAGVADARAIPDMLDAFAFETICARCSERTDDGTGRLYYLSDADGVQLDALSLAPSVVRDAFAWLSSRKLAWLESDTDDGERVEFIRMVQP